MVRRAGGGGLVAVVIAVGASLFFGVDPSMVLNQLSGGQPAGPQGGQIPQERNDEMKRFVAVVLAETEDTWSRIFKKGGSQYPAPKLVLFTGQVQSACGFGTAASGPFYCPADKKVYIDLAFYDQLKRSFGAPGDFAQAYVIAHEIGHHVQNLTGVLPKFNAARRSMGKQQENAMSIRVELQADCYAGVWANSTAQKGLLEQGDLEEALNAALKIGDDAIQKRTQGYVVPESFNHGTSKQRAEWFVRGLKSGDPGDCDTFNAGRV